MPPPLARSPHPGAGPASAAPCPAEADAGPAVGPAQQPLFDADAPPPAAPRTRHARLRGRLQALLARSAAVAGEASAAPRPSWPDSFFDVDVPP